MFIPRYPFQLEMRSCNSVCSFPAMAERVGGAQIAPVSATFSWVPSVLQVEGSILADEDEVKTPAGIHAHLAD